MDNTFEIWIGWVALYERGASLHERLRTSDERTPGWYERSRSFHDRESVLYERLRSFYDHPTKTLHI